MEKYIFKGIKQVTMGTYLSTVNKNGYLWFVREEIEKPEGSQSPFDVNRYHIYFGDKKYGESWNGLYEAIEAMASVITSNTDSISKKQDKIDDLDVIRSGAALGATALQEVPAEYITETELNAKNYLTEHQDISGKQDVISDLETIREGAALGATALQAVPDEYVTETELAGKNYATTSQVEAKQDAIADLETIRANALLGASALQAVPAEYVTETELAGMNYLTANDLVFATDGDIDGLFES